jgi:hypothetical protein
VPARAVLLVPAAFALLAGLDAALLLLGLPAPVDAARLPDVHGMLLVLGFVGTVVALERAVALGRRLGLAVPALLGAGGLLLVSPAPPTAGRAALVTGCAALLAVYVPLWRRQRDEAVLVQALGAVLAVGAAVLWLGGVAVSALLPWLGGFVVLTIAGERLELTRLTRRPTDAPVLLVLAATLVLGSVASLLWAPVGSPLLGAALAALVGRLVVRDVARRTVHASGLPRFAAAAMLSGYAWLAVAAAVWLVVGAAPAGAAYDAVVHALFLGFTMSMIMAHAPVIFPAVVRRPLPYTAWCWLPLLLLHASLLLRLWLGDALGSEAARQAGGALNVLAVLAFVVVTAGSAVTSRHRAGSR